MTVELRPLANKCNIKCTYCYQQFMRKNDEEKDYNIPLMLSTADKALVGAKENAHFVMFGGEPLLIPIGDLEKFFIHGKEKYERNGIQTNGSLITESHIKLFHNYNVSVGISIDGPGSLNDARESGTREATKANTRKTEEAIVKLIAAGIMPALIVTLHRVNYSQLETFLYWLIYLEQIGIRHINLHFLENDNADSLVLKEEELTHFIMEILNLNLKIRFDIFDDIQTLLLYDSEKKLESVSCTWNGCDPYTTSAVQGVKGDGSLGNCGRTNKTGIDYLKADRYGNERLLALYNTPEEYKGCKGCRFFFACKGHCPGEGEQKDWRNRTEHCGTIKAIYTEFENRIEKAGKVPISKNEEKRKKLEEKLVGKEVNSNSPHEDVYRFEVETR